MTPKPEIIPADFLRIVTGGRVLPGLTNGRESISVCEYNGFKFVIWLHP